MKCAPYYTQAELAKLANVTRHGIAKAILRKQIATTPTLGGTPLVARAEAARWIAARAK